MSWKALIRKRAILIGSLIHEKEALETCNYVKYDKNQINLLFL